MKIKIIYQHDQNDCGAACLSMIASYYRLFLPLQKVREMIGCSKHGASLFDMIKGAEKLGFCAEALNGSPQEMLLAARNEEIRLPFIAHMKNNHYVVVAKIEKKGITVFDPECGRRVIRIEDFFNNWSGYLINIIPGKTFREKKEYVTAIKRISMIIASEWKKIALVFFISIFIYIFGIIYSYTFQIFMDGHLNEEKSHTYGIECSDCGGICLEKDISEYNDSVSTVIISVFERSGSTNLFFILLIGMLLISTGVSYIRGKIIIWFSQNIDIKTSFKYYKKVFDIPLKEKNRRSNGEYLSRFSDAYRIRYAISNAVVSFFIDIVAAGIGVLVLSSINVSLLVIALIMLAVYSLIVLLFKNKLATSNKELMIENASMYSYFKETLEGFECIKATSSEKNVVKIGTKKYEKLLLKHYENDMLGLRESSLLNACELLGNVCIMWMGFIMVGKGSMSVGALITFVNVFAFFSEPIKSIITLQPTIQSAYTALERLFDILDITSEEVKDNGLDFKNGTIVFDKVSFSYDTSQPLFEDYSMRINEGELVGIAGESGIGKSTLMKLILRLYDCEKGEIRINGHPLQEYKLDEIRKKIAYVGQESFLFEGTILYNLTWDYERDFDEEIDKVCRICCVEDLISSLPFGYNTYIRENGDSLSGGQKQRLVLARHLLRNPEILILDEALCNVDDVALRKIMISLKEWRKEKTVIIISHSSELLEMCDRVIHLNI